MSQRILGLDWSEHLPWQVGALRVELGDFRADAVPFIASHYTSLFDSGDIQKRFLADPMNEAKLRFGDEMDVFKMTSDGRVVGVMMGHPLDWSSYYWRSVALLPEFRDGILASVLDRTYGPMRAAGIARVEGECSPTNAPMMRTLTKLGWVVSSTANSERWGATVRFTKFLRDDAEQVFARQFCGVRLEPPTSNRSTVS